MGGRNMSLVMRCIAGREVRIPWNEGERRKKDTEFHTLGPTELLLLLVIASRQRDEDLSYPADQCICIGGPETLTHSCHISRSSLFRARDFLIKSGLITFNAKGGWYLDLNDPKKRRFYTNVTQLNFSKLLEIERTIPRNENREEALPANASVPQGHSSVPQGHSSVPQGHSSVPQGHSSVPQGHSSVPQGNAEYREDTYTKNSKSRSTRKDCTAVATGGEISQLYAIKCRLYIRNAALLSDMEACAISRPTLAKMLVGKVPFEVKKAIDNILPTCQDVLKTDVQKWIRLVMKAIKDVPQSIVEPTAEEIEGAFILELHRFLSDKAAEIYWRWLCSDFGLYGCQASDFEDSKQLFIKTIRANHRDTLSKYNELRDAIRLKAKKKVGSKPIEKVEIDQKIVQELTKENCWRLIRQVISVWSKDAKDAQATPSSSNSEDNSEPSSEANSDQDSGYDSEQDSEYDSEQDSGYDS